MEAAAIDGRQVTLVLSLEELRVLNCTLNEVAHGPHIGDDEFERRVGAPRDRAEQLLTSIHTVLCAAEQFAPGARDD